MSKIVLAASMLAVMSLGGCFGPFAPKPVAAPEPIPEPVFVEPVATKKY